jgi:hypothetical protein
MIAHRRITNGGKPGAGVAVLMRYTLRLLTLDQLTARPESSTHWS